MQSGNPNDQDDIPYWQSPYQQPTVPGQLQYPPPYNAPRQRRPGFRQWFRTRTRRTKFGLGCGALVVILLLFFVCIIAASAASGIGTHAPTPTTGLVAVVASPTVLQDSPTPVPTQQPTPTPTPKPLPKPTIAPTLAVQPTQPPPPPKPTAKPCQAVNNNPWCYNFVPGNLIYWPPGNFCNYFNCIASFYQSDDPGDGYIVECSDGTYSQSGNERGACSYHGGVMRPLYSH